MAGNIVSRTAHFALHRVPLDVPSPMESAVEETATEGRFQIAPSGPGSKTQALFVVQEPWIGALIPKRWAKRAVTRNAIKRQIYTVSQDVTPPLPQAAHVVRLRTGFDRKQFISATSEALKRAVRGELQELFARAAP